MNTAAKLSGVAKSLDEMPAGGDNVREISPMTRAVKAELFHRANRPTANMDRMADQARNVLSILAEQTEQLEALRAVQQRGIDEDFERDQRADKAEIAALQKTIAGLRADMVAREEKHRAAVAAIDLDIDTQLAAVDRMRAAQQAVVEGLAKDITPAKFDERPPADLDSRRKSRRK